MSSNRPSSKQEKTRCPLGIRIHDLHVSNFALTQNGPATLVSGDYFSILRENICNVVSIHQIKILCNFELKRSNFAKIDFWLLGSFEKVTFSRNICLRADLQKIYAYVFGRLLHASMLQISAKSAEWLTRSSSHTHTYTHIVDGMPALEPNAIHYPLSWPDY